MKGLLITVSLLVSGVFMESAPYPPSGWKPSGPAFELPPRQAQAPQQEYLPVDPRRPLTPNNFDDNVDVQVQGLPTVEQQPIFEVSPVNGQQYTGPSINSDIGKLEPSFQQAQYQQQLEKAREFARQRQYDAATTPSNGLPNQQVPRQFAYQPATVKPSLKTPQAESTTEPIELNDGETLEYQSKGKKEKVTVEITKQNIQEYPPELFLSPLSQFNIQAQFLPLQQFGQLKAPIIYEAVPVSQGFDGPAHLSALPSVLAQRELLSQQARTQSQGFTQNPVVVQQEPLPQEPLNQYQPINQYQPVQEYYQFKDQQVIVPPQSVEQVQPNKYQTENLNQIPANQPDVPQYQYQPNHYQQPQIQSQIQTSQFQTPQYFNQIQPNPYQPTQNLIPSTQYQSQQPDVEEIDPNQQPQIAYQNYQPQFNQQATQPANQYQSPALIYSHAPQSLDLNQYYQNIQQKYDASQYQQSAAQAPGQVALQSGLDLNQQGNGIEQNEGRDVETVDEEEGSMATAVATAFGTRTQPRVFAQYGAPASGPKVQAYPGYPTTTDASAQDEPSTEDAPAVAEATAVATGRRNAKLRSRRIRPIFTIDRSGHLVLAQQ